MPHDLFAALPEADRPADAIERLFFGLMLPALQANQAADELAQSRTEHGIQGGAIRKDRLHITLIHIGDYRGALPRSVVASSVQAAGTVEAPAFDIDLDRASSFSGAPGKHPLVLLGGDGVAALKTFRNTLLSAVVRHGIKPLSRQDFTPHVTLSYADRRLPERPIRPITWRPEEFVLIHSEVGRSVYRTLGRWPLS